MSPRDRRANSLGTVVPERELHLPDTLTGVPTDPRGSEVRKCLDISSFLKPARIWGRGVEEEIREVDSWGVQAG